MNPLQLPAGMRVYLHREPVDFRHYVDLIVMLSYWGGTRIVAALSSQFTAHNNGVRVSLAITDESDKLPSSLFAKPSSCKISSAYLSALIDEELLTFS